MDITKEILKTAVGDFDDIECQQCGIIIRRDTWMKNRDRGNEKWDYCKSCKAHPVAYVTVRHKVLGLICCVPHRGELDEQWRPINAKGKLFRPGIRFCGNRDCISPSHIVAEMNPYAVSALIKKTFKKTGKLITLDEAIARIGQNGKNK